MVKDCSIDRINPDSRSTTDLILVGLMTQLNFINPVVLASAGLEFNSTFSPVWDEVWGNIMIFCYY